MKLLRTGVILNTENYESCVSFYEKVLGLKTLFTKAEAEHRLTCFDFGGAYLMVETGGIARPGGKSIEENCAKLRLHVQNLEAARQHLMAYGIGAEITKFSWVPPSTFTIPMEIESVSAKSMSFRNRWRNEGRGMCLKRTNNPVKSDKKVRCRGFNLAAPQLR